jgi:hypothetical protein
MPACLINFIAMRTMLLISICFLSLSSLGQNTFKLNLGGELHDSPFDILESEDHYLLTGSHRDLNNFTSIGFLYKISKLGVVLDSFEFSKVDTNILLTNIVQSNIGTLLLGLSGIPELDAYNYNSIYIAQLNKNFETRSENFFYLPNNYSGIFSSFFKHEDSCVYFSGDAKNQDYSNYKRDVFLYEINLHSETIDSTFIQFEGLQYASGLNIQPSTNVKYIYSIGNWGFPIGYGPGYCIKLDKNNNLIQIDTLPNGLQWENFSMNISENKFLLSGRQIVDPDINTDQTEHRCSIYKLNNNFHILNYYEFHQGYDTLSLLASVNTFDTTSGGEVYLSGCTNVIPQYFPYQQQPNWIYLSKLDNNLNEIWTHFYGGDIMYQVFSVKATTDNGAIITCGSYDYATQNLEHDILILKVNEDGLIVGTGEEHGDFTAQDAIVYPNPGNEYLKVQSGPQINGALFELFDLSGNLVLSTTLDERVKTINTSAVPPGTYPYRVTYQNKIVASGKWVKQ